MRERALKMPCLPGVRELPEVTSNRVSRRYTENPPKTPPLEAAFFLGVGDENQPIRKQGA